jgi:hypothetical protein
MNEPRFPYGLNQATPQTRGLATLARSPAPQAGDTGYPWVDGDVLYAADLNDAIAQGIAEGGGTGGGGDQLVFTADSFGAKGDRRQYAGTLSVAAGTNPTLTIAGADLSAVVPGQLVILPLGGPGAAGVKATVASVDVGASQITLMGSVATTLAGIAYQASGSPTIASAGTGVTPLDVYPLVGGVFAVAAQVTVQTTTVVKVVAVNTPGSGGIDGSYTFIGTSPGATKFQFTGTISGGVLAGFSNITPTVGGSYQKNPTALQAEPIVDVNGVSGLTGATVILSMGANSTQIQFQASTIANVTRAGGYSTFPADPVSTTGPGSGVTFNMAGCWVAPTVVIGTDNAPAINAARNALVAQGFVDAVGRPAARATLVFSSGGDYLVNGPLNFTSISNLAINGNRARIYSCAAGKPIFDALDTQNVAFTNMSISGDPTFPPRWSFQIGRISNTLTAAANTFDQLFIGGTFVDAGFDYNCCSEAINMGLVRGNFIAPYGRIEDAANSSFWNVTSDFVTSTMTVDHAQPFQGGNPGQVSLINEHPNGYGVWMLGGSIHAYDNAYFFCHQDVFVIIVSSLASVASGLQAPSCHIEGARRAVVFRKGPTGGYGVPRFDRFVFSDSGCYVTENLFGVTEPGIVHVRVFNSNITVGFGSPTAGYFDDESMVTHSSIIVGADGGVVGRWQQNVPADMTGLALLTSSDAPELFAYNLVAQTDTDINGQLSVSGPAQTAGQLSVSDGTVASVKVNTYGMYINPDYPTVTIDPSPGVSAVASVTAMQWLSDMHVVAGGSGYAVNDIVSFNPALGTHAVVAKLRVTGVDGSGAVTSFTGYDPGAYSAYPPVGATTTTGGSGTGLVINPLDWGVRKDAAGTGVTVVNHGSGYTSFPDVTFSAPVNGASAARGTVAMGRAWYADSVGAQFNVPVTVLNPVSGPQAANKSYVDGMAAGLSVKAASRLATTANIATWPPVGPLTIDGVLTVGGDRVLVKDQTTQSQNGIYVAGAAGITWTRATDTDAWAELVQAYTLIQNGAVNASNGYFCNVVAGGTIGTTPITWVQFSSAGTSLPEAPTDGVTYGRQGSTTSWQGVLPLTAGPTQPLTGNVVLASPAVAVSFSAAAGTQTSVNFNAGGLQNWSLIRDNTALGSNLGAKFGLQAFSDTGAPLGYLWQGSRGSGPTGQGGPQFNIFHPYSMATPRATTPGGVVGNDTEFTSGDVQPTTTLGTDPFAVTSGSATVFVTWTGCGLGTGAINGATESWVFIAGAAAVGGITPAGWYRAARTDNNRFTIVHGSNATSTVSAGGGSTVTVQPSFNTSQHKDFHISTSPASGYSLQYSRLYAANPQFLPTVGRAAPQYQQEWRVVIGPNDTTPVNTNSWAVMGTEMDLINRGPDVGYYPYIYGAPTPTVGFWVGTSPGPIFSGTGGGTAANWNTVYTIYSHGGLVGVYTGYSMQPNALVGAANDPTGHGGVGFVSFGAYDPIQAGQVSTTSGTSTVTFTIPSGGGGIQTQVNGGSVYIPVVTTLNGVTVGGGSYVMSGVTTTSFNVTGTGTASATGSGGAAQWVAFANLVPYAPIEFQGSFKHGISTANFRSEDGSIIHTQPGNGIVWDDGTGTASVTGVASSPGAVSVQVNGPLLLTGAVVSANGPATLTGAAIQALHDALPATGGNITLSPNTVYTVSTEIAITKPNVRIVGPSWGTILRRTIGMTGAVINITGAGCVIENLTVDGNATVFDGASHAELRMVSANGLIDNVQVLKGGGTIHVTLSGEGACIRNSTITGLAMAPPTETNYGVWALGGTNVKIQNNTITGTGIDAIGFDGVGSICTGNRVSNCHWYVANGGGQIACYSTTAGGVIANNTIGPGGATAAGGIEVDGDNIIITGNEIIGVQGNGIGLTTHASHILVDGNLVKNTGSGGVVFIGIYVAAGVSDFQIINNRVFDDQGTKTMRWGVSITAGAGDRYVVQGNVLAPTVTGALSDGGTGLDKIISDNVGVDDVIGTVASAVTVTLPLNSIVSLTGTTGITAIAAAGSWRGRKLTLIPTGVLTVTAGATIANTITTTANVPVQALFDGTLWHFQTAFAGALTATSGLVTSYTGTLPTAVPLSLFDIVGSGASNLRQSMTAAGGTPSMIFRSAGGTMGVPTPTPNNQVMGGLAVTGYAPTAGWGTTALGSIQFTAAGLWSDTSQPTFIQFLTTPVSSTTPAECMRVSPNGNLLIGGTVDGAIKLDVTGTSRFQGVGFYNATPVAVKPTVTGSKGANAALASLLTALAAYGLVTDSST